MKYFVTPLAVGWFLGAASVLLFVHLAHGPMMHGRPAHRMRERFASELKLSPDQKQKIDAIFEAGHQKINAIFEQNKTPLEAVRTETRSEIRVLLDPDQQMAFDKMETKMAAHFKKRFEEGPDQWH